MIDGEPEHLDEGEGAHQGNWNGQAGHHRGPPVLQKDEQDQQHQHDRQAESIHNALHGGLNELADVVHLRHGHAWRRGGGKGIDLFHDGIRHIQSIAVRGLEHRHGDRVVVRDIHCCCCVVVEAVLHLAHIFEQQKIACFGAADDQILEVFQAEQIAVVLHQ